MPARTRPRVSPVYYSHEILCHPDTAFYFEDDQPSITLAMLDEVDDAYIYQQALDALEENANDTEGSLCDFIEHDDDGHDSDSAFVPESDPSE